MKWPQQKPCPKPSCSQKHSMGAPRQESPHGVWDEHEAMPGKEGKLHPVACHTHQHWVPCSGDHAVFRGCVQQPHRNFFSEPCAQPRSLGTRARAPPQTGPQVWPVHIRTIISRYQQLHTYIGFAARGSSNVPGNGQRRAQSASWGEGRLKQVRIPVRSLSCSGLSAHSRESRKPTELQQSLGTRPHFRAPWIGWLGQ